MTTETPSPQDAFGRSRTHWRRIAGVLCLGIGVGLALLTYLRSRPVQVVLEYQVPRERLDGATELLIAIETDGGGQVSQSLFQCPSGGVWPQRLHHSLRLPRGVYRLSAGAQGTAGRFLSERLVRIDGEGTFFVPLDTR